MIALKYQRRSSPTAYVIFLKFDFFLKKIMIFYLKRDISQTNTLSIFRFRL